jgi:transposase-like protein
MTKTVKSKQNGHYVGMPSLSHEQVVDPDAAPSPSGSRETEAPQEVVFDDARKAEAVALLAIGTSVSETARQVGVNRSTIYRWLSDPDLGQALKERREELIEQTFNLQVFASLQATKKLLELLDHEDPRFAFWSARILAPLKDAYMVMDHERRVRQMEDIVDFPV